MATAAQRISPALSLNYSFAKVIAILTVTAGHWFTGTILWIPVTFGLFVFAFSSGFFTAVLYGPQVDRASFWRKKLQRLGVRYWIILGFIAILASIQGKNVLHWHTAVHALGLSGVLNWMAVRNHSALGAGLWFFTLLLLFYLVYPYLAQAVRSRGAAGAVLLGGFALAVYLEENIKVGHELWLTTFGFVSGVAWGMHRPSLSARWVLAVTILLWGALLVLNLAGHKMFNTFLIAAGGMAVAVWLTVAQLPRWTIVQGIAALDKYLLEIFMVHMYLFVHPSAHSVLDFLISLALVLVVAVMLGRLADLVSARLFDRRPAR